MLEEVERIDFENADHSSFKVPPGGRDDDMWMKCLYGLCTEAVNHHSPAALGRMTVLSGTRCVFKREGGEFGGKLCHSDSG